MPTRDAREFAETWLADWNAHDLDAVLDHYDAEVALYSPMIARVTGEPLSCLRGRDALRKYWRRALDLSPDLRFDLETVLVGAESLTILYVNQRGRRAAETFVFNATSKVAVSVATYAEP